MSDVIKPWLWPGIEQEFRNLYKQKETPGSPEQIDKSRITVLDSKTFQFLSQRRGSNLQILQIGRNQTNVKLILSDKANTIGAFISRAAEATFEAQTLQRLAAGGILQVHEYNILVSRSPRQRQFALHILNFAWLGSAGSGKFGQPTPIEVQAGARTSLVGFDVLPKQPSQPPYTAQEVMENSGPDAKSADDVDDDLDEGAKTNSQIGYATQMPENTRRRSLEQQHDSSVYQDEVRVIGADEMSDVCSQADPNENGLGKHGATRTNHISLGPNPALKITARSDSSDLIGKGKNVNNPRDLISLLQNRPNKQSRAVSTLRKSTTPQSRSPSTHISKYGPSPAEGDLPNDYTSLSPSEKIDLYAAEVSSHIELVSQTYRSKEQSRSSRAIDKSIAPKQESSEAQKDSNMLLNSAESTSELQQKAPQSKIEMVFVPSEQEEVIKIVGGSGISKTVNQERFTTQHPWETEISRISRKLVTVPKNQRELLDNENCWIPAEAGNREPRANMPPTVLHEYTTRIDQIARKPQHQGQRSSSNQNSPSRKGISSAGLDDSDDPEQFATSQDWPPSQHTVTVTNRLPPDTPSSTERPQRQRRTRSRDSDLEDSPLPSLQRKRQKTVFGEESHGRHKFSPRGSQKGTDNAISDYSRGVSSLNESHQSSSPIPRPPSISPNACKGFQLSLSQSNSAAIDQHNDASTTSDQKLTSSSPQNIIDLNVSAAESDSDLETSIPQPLNNQLHSQESPSPIPMNGKMNTNSVLQVTRTPYSLTPKRQGRFVSELDKASLPRKLLLPPIDKSFGQLDIAPRTFDSSSSISMPNQPLNTDKAEDIQTSPVDKFKNSEKDDNSDLTRSKTPQSIESNTYSQQTPSRPLSNQTPLPSISEELTATVCPTTKRKAGESVADLSNVVSRKKNFRITKRFGFSQLPPEIEDPKLVLRRQRREFMASRRRTDASSESKDDDSENYMEIDGQALGFSAAAESDHPTSSSDILSPNPRPVKMGTDHPSNPDSENQDSIRDQEMVEVPLNLPNAQSTEVPAMGSQLSNAASPSSSAHEKKVSPPLKAEQPPLVQINQGSLFDRFKQAYPQYTGNEAHFLAMCRKIDVLIKQDRMEHRALWDDFIVRQTMEYRQHLLRCSEQADDPMPYEKFYREEIEEPQYTKRVITPANLREMIQSREPTPRESVAKHPSVLQPRFENHKQTRNPSSAKTYPSSPAVVVQPLVNLISEAGSSSDSAPSPSLTAHNQLRPRSSRAPENPLERIRSFINTPTPSLGSKPAREMSPNRAAIPTKHLKRSLTNLSSNQPPLRIMPYTTPDKNLNSMALSHLSQDTIGQPYARPPAQQNPVQTSQPPQEGPIARFQNTYRPPRPFKSFPRTSFPNERILYQRGPSQQWYRENDAPYNEFARAYQAIQAGNGNAFYHEQDNAGTGSNGAENDGGSEEGEIGEKRKWGTGVSGWKI